MKTTAFRKLLWVWTWMVLGFSFGGHASEGGLTTTDGFAVPQPGRRFVFPRDHGSHPEFSVEWWYITGHLFTTNQEQFGFQATFFRRSLASEGGSAGSSNALFGTDQIYLAHMALVNIGSGMFRHQERLNRSGWDANSSQITLDVFNGNWSLRFAPANSNTISRDLMELRYTLGGDISVRLDLTPKKSLVVFGTNGVSRKAAEPTASSHYLTFPRLSISGNLIQNGKAKAVSGEAWMDHEMSSSQLGAGQVGWDWLSLQLFDGREIMAYRMRRADGSTDPYSTVAWVDTNGLVSHIGPDQFKWVAMEHWRSPKTSAEYPSKVQLEAVNPVSGRTEIFVIQPLVADQELTGKVGGVAYWEGACSILDQTGKLIGRAYMELTGYNNSLKGKF